jgi:hypothetical protein
MRQISELRLPGSVEYLFRYLMLALDCDSRILESVFFTFPLGVMPSQHVAKFRNPGVFFIIMFNTFIQILNQMACPGKLLGRRGLDVYDTASFCIWETSTTPQLRLICEDDRVTCALAHPRDRHNHIASFRIYTNLDGRVIVFVKGGEDALWFDWEWLNLLTYRPQMHRLFSAFMRLMPAYWQSYKPLPSFLEF